jgi:hypothetical protein
VYLRECDVRAYLGKGCWVCTYILHSLSINCCAVDTGKPSKSVSGCRSDCSSSNKRKKNINSIHLSGEKATTRSPSFQMSSSDISCGC